MQDHLFIIHN